MESSRKGDPASKGIRGKQARGEQRRQSLIHAGTELLTEKGWLALTSRAVAERAGATPGLVHYYFADQADLKRAIASTAVSHAFEPVLQLLTSHDSWQEGVAAAAQATQTMAANEAQVSAELIAASLHDPDVAEVLRQALAETRSELLPWLRRVGTTDPEGLATAIIALLDGLLLHRLIDRNLPIHAAAHALGAHSSDPRQRHGQEA